MRRSLGATTVKLDARDGTAECVISHPRKLDLPALEKAVHGAGYTLTLVEIEAAGRVVPGSTSAGEPGSFFELPGTGQRFAIEGEGIADGPVKIRGEISAWAKGDPILKVLDAALR